MNLKSAVTVFTFGLLLSTSCQAKKRNYQRGSLLKMQSTSCGYQEKGGRTVAGELLGTDRQHTKSQQLLCQEYTLQTDQLIYRLRPTDEKHPALLPIGETAEFRIHKDKLILRVPEGDDKERSYYVISMTPRATTQARVTTDN